MHQRTHTHAAILSIGDELTLGQSLDTNSRTLSQRLVDLGIVPIEHATVPDDIERHVAALERLASIAPLVISTGGLGPTPDDLTRNALARLLRQPLVQDDLSLAQIEAFFEAAGTTMRPNNRLQAFRPEGSHALPNLRGTAPGLFASVEINANPCDVFCLPGPPGEMIPMFVAQVLPRLRPPMDRVVRTRAIHCVGLGESEIASRLGDRMNRDASPLVGTTASGGIISVRLRLEVAASGPEAIADADATLDAAVAGIRPLLAPHIFSDDTPSLAQTIVSRMKSAGHTLALAESCTGGTLAGQITDIPGSSAVLRAGWVVYTEEAKARDLGVDAALLHAHGVYSAQCATDLATRARAIAGTSHAIGITGLAGPDGGTRETPIGSVWIALATPTGVDTRRFKFSGDRAAIRRSACVSALATLWLNLSGSPNTRLMRQSDVL
ncbi:MAG: CinA family nicotinamide mononucleotide deamidase-related protein [Phycisphaerales bacterium]